MPYLTEHIIEDIKVVFWEIKEREIDLMKDVILSPQTISRLKEISSEKRRKEIFATRRLFEHLNIEDRDVKYKKNGKPELKTGGFISISHSNKLVGVAKAEVPVGLDIQYIESKIEKLAEKYLSYKEIKQKIHNSVFRLTLLWAAKEAIYKLAEISALELAQIDVDAPFEPSDGGVITASIHDKKMNFVLTYKKIGNYIWVLAQKAR